MLSLPPDCYTLGGLAIIANDGVDSVRSAIKELEKYGYLVRFQSRDERGRMSVNEYTVYENPELNPNSAQSEKDNYVLEKNQKSAAKWRTAPTEKTETNEKSADFSRSPSLKNSPSKKSLSENPTTATYNILNTQLLSTHQSNQSISRAYAREDMTDMIKDVDLKGLTDERNYYRELIRKNIEYDFLYQNRNNSKLKINIGKIDEIVSIMVNVVCSHRQTVRVNGEELPQENVKRRFLELDQDHIDYALTALERNAGDVRNIRAYLITVLYNAPDTMEIYYDAWVKRDLRGG
ncbi:MAG: DUF6017 domain-containing protein [Bacteroides sp.]|nr:DUF6017 domain-containing protein [Eubacterium sp.]MCM1417520.1 DUF6017 domain-containing protein [Roseburia sp.]MCM1462555.1 DUF6017 domain-containing protein [Bacteroides sp.]